MDIDTDYYTMQSFRVKVAGNGRMVIPQSIRDELGISSGDTLLLHRDDVGIHLLTADQAVRQAQAIVARHLPPGADLVDDLRALRNGDATGR